MSSIAEALVATAVGLFVAIPAVAAFNWFQRRIQTVQANTEALGNVVLAHLAAEAPAAELQPAAS
jgi:biopolymer transport protein ExbB